MNLTEDERSHLECYGPDTYAMEMPLDIAKSLEAKGLVEWVPPVFGTCWAITDAGRAALADLAKWEDRQALLDRAVEYAAKGKE